jgi:hypothetical protein
LNMHWGYRPFQIKRLISHFISDSNTAPHSIAACNRDWRNTSYYLPTRDRSYDFSLLPATHSICHTPLYFTRHKSKRWLQRGLKSLDLGPYVVISTSISLESASRRQYFDYSSWLLGANGGFHEHYSISWQKMTASAWIRNFYNISTLWHYRPVSAMRQKYLVELPLLSYVTTATLCHFARYSQLAFPQHAGLVYFKAGI